MELTIAFISVLFIGLSTASPHSRIVCGQNAKKGSAPYIASLQEKDEENGVQKLFHFCGGAILNDKWILTAAHCFRHRPDKEIFAAVGLTKLTEGGEIYKMEKYIAHENYDHYDIINDIALLKVEGNIKFSEKVSPVILGKEFVGSGIQLTLNGWGVLGEGANATIPSNKLQVMHPKSLSFDECVSYHYRPVRETQICAMAKKGTSACSGDSGGPLIMDKNTLVGLVSWGMHPCGNGYYPDVYTRITSYLDWIEQNMID